MSRAGWNVVVDFNSLSLGHCIESSGFLSMSRPWGGGSSFEKEVASKWQARPCRWSTVEQKST